MASIGWMGSSLVRTGCIIAVSFEDNVSHTAGVKEPGDSFRLDIFIAIHHEDNVLTFSDPSIAFTLEVVKDGCPRFAVLILGLGVRSLLGPCRIGRSRGLLTWSIGCTNT
jgi:hypothetical protein